MHVRDMGTDPQVSYVGSCLRAVPVKVHRVAHMDRAADLPPLQSQCPSRVAGLCNALKLGQRSAAGPNRRSSWVAAAASAGAAAKSPASQGIAGMPHPSRLTSWQGGQCCADATCSQNVPLAALNASVTVGIMLLINIHFRIALHWPRCIRRPATGLTSGCCTESHCLAVRWSLTLRT